MAWFSKYDIKVRAVAVQGARQLIITLTDHKHKCVLDIEKHQWPSNYSDNPKKLNRWVAGKINLFLADCREIGIDVEYVTATNAGFCLRMIEKARMKMRRSRNGNK